jgi:cysteinyl-tRNA synthetase
MPIRLYDSLSRELRALQPSHPDGVIRFYNCGPTVYAPAHIGNFRTFIINDVLRRLLELEFGPGKVKHVRNLTDVDDKTIRRAREEGRPLAAVTQQWTDKFHVDCAALNCLPPHLEPTATGHIPEQVDMIDVLMKQGNAYRAPDGSVYFKVSSFDHYGELSRVKERELQPGATLKLAAADADEKEDVSDFALWKAHKPEDGANRWDSPWGAGRPGWHIECSAMIKKHLGETIDLHTGGEDLLFPHHENEIAQSECCNGVTFSRLWYHSKHLLVDGKKMSKSDGTLYTLDDLLEKSFSAMDVRRTLLFGHPRKQLNFTLEVLQNAQTELNNINKRIRGLGVVGNALFRAEERDAILAAANPTDWGSFEKAWRLLQDDLNLPAAHGAAFDAFHELTVLEIQDKLPQERARIEFCAAVRFFQTALGYSLDLASVEEKDSVMKSETPIAVTALAEKRWAAKHSKDFAAADALRQELTAAGWSMLDRKDGYSLEPLKKI